MHIADGILPASACVVAHGVAFGGVSLICRKVDQREIPRMGLMAAMTFAASLVHFPLGGTSMHLGLFGLAGVLLGPRAFAVVYASLLLQAVLFQHGGLLSWGVNSLNMGAGALLGWLCWRMPALPRPARGFLAGFAGTQIPALLMAGEFALAGYGKGFYVISGLYLVVALVEGAVTSATVTFLDRTQPQVLGRPRTARAQTPGAAEA